MPLGYTSRHYGTLARVHGTFMYYLSFAGQALASIAEQLCEHVYYSRPLFNQTLSPCQTVSSSRCRQYVSLSLSHAAHGKELPRGLRASTRGPFGMRGGRRRAILDETLPGTKLSGGKKMSRSGYSGESRSFHQNTPSRRLPLRIPRMELSSLTIWLIHLHETVELTSN